MVIDSDELPNLPIDELEGIQAYWFNQWNFVDGSKLNETAYDRVAYSIKVIKSNLRWDTSNVTNMTSMFAHCSSLTTIDISAWDFDAEL